MRELDLDDLTAEIFKRVLRMRSTLDEQEFDFLAGELMVSMGAAAMRKAETLAFRPKAIRRSDKSGKVIDFPARDRRARNGTGADSP